MSVPRVVHVVATEQRRGAEVFAADLVRALAVEGLEQRVVVLRPGAGTAVDFGVTTTRLPSASLRWFAAVAAARGLRRMLRAHPDAIVCAHGGEALRAAVLSGARPVVYRRIGAAPPSIITGLRRRWHGFLMGRAALVLCVAEAVREETVRVFALDASRVRTVPNGVDPDRLDAPNRAMCREALGLEQDARVVLSLGSLSSDKDPVRALHITEAARVEDLRAVHLFVGDGPLAGGLAAAAGGDGRVRVLPGRADVGTVLGAADLLLLSSGMEGMPAVVIEAGLCGLPVVADRVGGVAEVVVDGATGVLVAPGDDRAAAEAVCALLSDDARRHALGAAAASRCAARFAIGPVARAYVAAFDEVARGRNPDDSPLPGEDRRRADRAGSSLVSVLMSVYNSEATLGEQLAALADQTYEGPWELLIDDNGSTDESLAIARGWLGALPQLRVIDASERRGDPGARNLGALHARGETLVFCDSDDIVDRDWLRWIVAGMDDHDMVVGACHLRHDERSGPGSTSGARMLNYDGGYGYLPFGVSANMAVSADAYRLLGGFREDYPAAYDVDLCWRLQLTGLRFGLEPRAVVYKRSRGTIRGAWRQHFAYGQGDVVLFGRFRRQGMPRNVGRAIRVYGWLAVNALRLRQPDVRFVWVRMCGKCCGRVVGSLRERTLYL